MSKTKTIIAKIAQGVKEALRLEVDTGEILHDESATGRERPWGRHKLSNQVLVALFELARKIDETVISESRLDALQHCADVLVFGRAIDGAKRLLSANFCRIRVCPMCCWRRSLKMFSQVSTITSKILERKPKMRFVFLTLTVRNCEGHELKQTLDMLDKGWSYITAKSRTFAPAKRLKQNLLGYMRAVEITYSVERDDFHPHIHAILELQPSYFRGQDYISKRGWIELWQAACGLDYAPSIDIRTISTTAKAVAEVAKYPVKMDNILKVEDKQAGAIALIQLYRAIFRRRLVTFGGEFREIARELKLKDVEHDDDLIHVDDDATSLNYVARVLYKWRAGCGCYIC